MADNVNLETSISVDTNKGQQDVRGLATQFANMAEALRGVQQAASQAAKGMESAERAASGIKNSTKSASTQVDALAKSYENANRAVGNYRKTLSGGSGLTNTAAKVLDSPKRSADTVGNLSNKTDRESAAATLTARNQALRIANLQKIADQKAIDDAAKLLALYKQQLQTKQAAANGIGANGVKSAAGSASVFGGSLTAGEIAGKALGQNLIGNMSTGPSEAFTKAQKQLNLSMLEAQRNARIAGDAIGDYRDRLANTRYALYDVSNSLAIAGAAMIAFNVGTVKAAADYETAFAQISRTSGATGQDLQTLESDFLHLAQNIPVAFDDLAKIGTLAGQLNVPANQIADFSKVTAQFSATTNVTAEAAATAFGRLDALLPDVQGNYAALGSSILNVGVNSVATEQQIIETATQIAAAGTQAGFSADQVIGLAASFASLGVAPEQARGVVTRVFYDISTAISEGGDSLDKFAELSDLSAEQFKAAWSNDAGATFTKFLEGLNKQGGNAQATINDLGITAVRDANSLLRLSQSVDQVSANLGYASDGFADTTTLSRAFATQAATLASKVQELINSLQGFFAVIGASGLPILSSFVDGLKGLVVGLTAIAATPVGQALGLVIGVFTAVNGLALLLGSGLARVVAGFLAFNPAIALAKSSLTAFNAQVAATSAEAAVAGVSLTTMQARLATVGATARAAGVALKGALASTGIGLAVVGVVAGLELLSEQFKSNADRAQEMFGSVDALSNALAQDAGVKDGTTKQISLGGAVENTTTKIKQQTVAYGDNTKAALAAALANNQAYKDLFSGKQASILKPTGFNAEDFTKAILGDPEKGADEYIAKLKAKFEKGIDVSKLTNTSGAKTAYSFQVDAARKSLDELGKSSGAIKGLIAGSVAAMKAQSTANRALGAAAEGAANDLEAEGDAAKTLADQLKSAFASINAASDVGTTVDALATSIYNAGTSFSYLNATGTQNLANIQAAIAAVITDGANLGLSSTQAVSALFTNLQQQGVDTAALLATLSGSLSNAGVDTSQLTDANRAGDSAAGAYATTLNAVSDNAIKVASSQKAAGGATRDTAKEMRTAADYASDLTGVFSRMFDIKDGVQAARDAIQQQLNDQKKARQEAKATLKQDRADLKKANAEYGKVFAETFAETYGNVLSENLSKAFDNLFARQAGLDNIQSQFIGLQRTITDANDDLKELNASLLKLQSTKNIKTIQLGTAQNYGDTTRATDLQADLADVDSKIADNAKSAAEANDKLNRTLVGNSAAAIQNRSDLLGLVSGYQSYIDTLQSTGAGSDEINKAIGDSKKSFTDQAKALGFSDEQLSSFVAVFDQYKNANYAAGVAANTAALDAQAEALKAVKDIQKDIAAQQEILSTKMDGNSSAAIRNRGAYRDLQGKIGEYAGALAAAGYNQDEIKGKLENFANITLPAQGRAAGLSKGQIDLLKESIGDMSRIVDKVPRNLTVNITADTNPADAALREFQERMKAQKDKKYSGGTVTAPKFDNGDDIGQITRRTLTLEIARLQALYAQQVNTGVNNRAAVSYLEDIKRMTQQLRSGNFASGGFTGNGGKYDAAGTVHKGEFVIPKQYVDQSKGMPNASAMNWLSGMTSTSGGPQQVELSPTDRALLSAAGNVTVTVDGKVIANATNANNLNSAMRGSN